MVHPLASNDRKLSNSGHFFFFFKLDGGELEWSAEREYGVIHFGKKSVILFDTRECAQIKKI